jgi:ribose/xylose/arabinose/galactoside ABC-type transport system permease subunit
VKNNFLKELLSKWGVPLFLVFSLLITQLLYRDVGILKASNIDLVLQQSAVPIILALGLSLIMIGGEIDLSIAGSIGLSGSLFVTCMKSGIGLGASIALTIAATVVVGLLNGLLVGKLGFSSFLVTVSTMFVTLGLQNTVSGGMTVWLTDASVTGLSKLRLLGIPVFIVIFLVMAIVYYFFIYHTKWGFNVRVVGENSIAADEVGINTQLVKIMIFVLAGVFYGVAGIIEPIRVSGSVLYSGQMMLLPAMAACYLGSTMFIPGRVNVGGTLFSALFLSSILNILTLLNVRYYFVALIQGLVIIVAVIISNIRNRSIKQIIT